MNITKLFVIGFILILFTGCFHAVLPTMDFVVRNGYGHVEDYDISVCSGGLKARLAVGDLVLESALVLPKHQYVVERMNIPKTVYNGVPVVLEAWCHNINNENDIGYINLKTKWKGHLANTVYISPPRLDRSGCVKSNIEKKPVPCIDVHSPFSN